MNASRRQRTRRPPYWVLFAFVVVMTLPHLWAGVTLFAAAALVGVSGVAERLRARPRRGAGRSEQGDIMLGVGADGARIELSDRQLSAHALILGASGAGKSTTLLNILCAQIGRGRPVVAIDMKGSPAFAHRLQEAAAAAGRPFRMWTPDGPHGWNPLEYGNPTELKDKLIATERFTEPHYRRAAERYAQTALQALAHAHPGRAPTLTEVVRAMDPGRLAAVLRHAPAPFAERVQDYLATLSPDQVSAIRGLATRLAIVSESEAARFLEAPGPGPRIDLRQALAGEQVVLFSLNSSTYGEFAAQLGGLVIQDLITVAGHRLSESPGTLPDATVAIDELSALRTDNLVTLVARGREAGMCMLLATQELADLDRAGRGIRDQILGNTAVKIAHRQEVPESAQTIAQIVGTETVWEQTRQLARHPLFGSYETGRGTERQVERFWVHPNQIKTLPTGHAVVITKLPEARARTVRIDPPRRPAGPPRRPDGPVLG